VTEAVSNAGPLMVLAKLHLLHLLAELYDQVRIPRSVYSETVAEGLRQGYADARTLYHFLERMGWQAKDIHVDGIPDHLRHAPLDIGERDALALALKLGNLTLLMDESIGRTYARQYGLAVCGSLGILIEAYRQKLLDSDRLRLALNEMAQRSDIWISPTLVERVLREVLEE
jgi:predicted nucleic acid-binding protein